MDINRKTVFDVLIDVEKNKAYSNISLNNFIMKNKADNVSFVRELVYGVLKNKYYLDYCLKVFVHKGFTRLKTQDLILLRMGAYQILMMNSVPEYAAVSETVDLAKKYAYGKERFINGVLRSLVREKTSIELPDSERNPYRYLSIKYSVEEWIVDILVNAYGFKEAENYLIKSNETPGLSIRVNLLKSNRDSLIKLLTEAGFEASESSISARGIIVKGSGLINSKLFKEGYFTVQDEASILATDILDPKPGEYIIDLCAAPGGKTCGASELMKNSGSVLACDYYENKLDKITDLCKRQGVTIVKTMTHDATRVMSDQIKKADRVICDVPCSGLGVIRRKPEIKYKNDINLDELILRQQKIIIAASKYVKTGGVLLYSTCTVNPEENENQIVKFLKDNPGFRIEREEKLTPMGGTDGFYICKLIREV